MGELDREQGWGGHLVLDAGDLLYDGYTFEESQAERALARAELIVEQFNRIGTDGIALGDRDVVLGLQTLEKLHRKADFPFLAANLVDRNTGEPIFDTHVIREIAGVKVGVFGVTTRSAGRIRGQTSDPAWKIEDPVATARREVKALDEEGADLVIALAHLNDKVARRLAEEVDGITAVLGGNQVRAVRHPETVDGTVFAHGFSKGKYLSVLTVHLWKDRPVTRDLVDRFRKEGLRDRIERTEGKITSYERIVKRKEEAAEDEEEEEADARRPARRRTASAEFYKKQLARFRAEKKALEMDLAEAEEVDAGAHFFTYDFVPVRKAVEPEPTIHEDVQAFRKKYPEKKGH
ncbi:MAG: hypothetical protein ACQEXJ_22180 [Myxococcota bacterium]